MEWVVASAPTVGEARERTLDLLGVDESEAEFEVMVEPRPGLFGRTRGQARVRARIVPRTPPPKVDRPRRTRGSGKRRRGGRTSNDQAQQPKRKKKQAQPAGTSKPSRSETPAAADPTDAAPRSSTNDRAPAPSRPEEAPMSDITLTAQAEATADFLRGLLDAFDFDGSVDINDIDDENIEVAVDGDDLGILIGPRGQTLQAIGELARAASAQTLSGRAPGRVHLDIARYRQKRREALAAFTRKIADEVLESGTAKALEPMSAADRKVVHDTCNDIDGVTTLSEGEEPRRRVVIEPAD